MVCLLNPCLFKENKCKKILRMILYWLYVFVFYLLDSFILKLYDLWNLLLKIQWKLNENWLTYNNIKNHRLKIIEIFIIFINLKFNLIYVKFANTCCNLFQFYLSSFFSYDLNSGTETFTTIEDRMKLSLNWNERC